MFCSVLVVLLCARSWNGWTTRGEFGNIWTHQRRSLLRRRFSNGSYALLMVIGRELEDLSPPVTLGENSKPHHSPCWIGQDPKPSLSTLKPSVLFRFRMTLAQHTATPIIIWTPSQTEFEQAHLPSPKSGWFIIPEYIDLNGVNLNNPRTLPTQVRIREFTTDEDGQIGVTITVDASVGTGEVYAIQRRSYARMARPLAKKNRGLCRCFSRTGLLDFEFGSSTAPVKIEQTATPPEAFHHTRDRSILGMSISWTISPLF